MKKLIAVLLAAAAVLSISICAFAADLSIDQAHNTGKTDLTLDVIDPVPDSYTIKIPSALSLNDTKMYKGYSVGLLTLSYDISHLAIGHVLNVAVSSQNYNSGFQLQSTNQDYSAYTVPYQMWSDRFGGESVSNGSSFISDIKSGVRTLYIAAEPSINTPYVSYTDTLTFTASISQS